MKNATRVLVIGQGGREHAIVRQIAQNSSIETVYVIPGSDGMAGTPKVECVAMSLDSSGFVGLIAFAKEKRIDLVVIGPEQPLADGLADMARAAGFKVFGPSKEGARLEASKIHAKELMKAAGVRTARSFVVSTVDETIKAASAFQPPYVLKADGLAAGKGVFIEKTLDGLKSAARFLFEEKGLEMLEKWEKEGVSFLLGEDKKRIIDETNATTTTIDLDAPISSGKAKSGEKSQYTDLFDF